MLSRWVLWCVCNVCDECICVLFVLWRAVLNLCVHVCVCECVRTFSFRQSTAVGAWSAVSAAVRAALSPTAAATSAGFLLGLPLVTGWTASTWAVSRSLCKQMSTADFTFFEVRPSVSGYTGSSWAIFLMFSIDDGKMMSGFIICTTPREYEFSALTKRVKSFQWGGECVFNILCRGYTLTSC